MFDKFLKFPLKVDPDVTFPLGALLSWLFGDAVLDQFGLFSGVLSPLAVSTCCCSSVTVSAPFHYQPARWEH